MKFCLRVLLIVIIIILGVILALLYLMSSKTREGIDPDIKSITDPLLSFCSSYLGNSSELNTSCAQLTKRNCKKTSCCVLLNNESCVAGDKTGPRYKSNPSGERIEVGGYHHEGKCYGEMCE